MQQDTAQKLKTLGELARFDVTGIPTLLNPQGYLKHTHFIYPAPFYAFEKFHYLKRCGVYPAVGFKGSCCNLFKVLQTNLCKYNCFYCANRCARNTPRLSFGPEELARVFFYFYRRRWVEGLFLSSGIFPDANQAQEKMLITLKSVRQAGFRGYIHSVILPGADDALIEEIGMLSDRISLNLEAPNQKYLSLLSPDKDFPGGLFNDLKKLHTFHKRHPLKAGLSTQLVVGAAEESDKEILAFSQRLYGDLSLDRVYYSGFTPVQDTPFEYMAACPSMREARLYQADFLLRGYGFKAEELVFNAEGNLYLDMDPKLAWAKTHPAEFPVELSTSSLEQILRVPGIGRISAERIIALRKTARISSLEELKKTGAVVSRARNFVTLAGRMFASKGRPAINKSKEKQLFLWEEL